MTSTSRIPEPIPALTPELYESLKARIQKTLTAIVSNNRKTRFFSESPVCNGLRSALAAYGDNDGVPGDIAGESYRTTIPFTSYNDYESFVSRFTPNCKLEDVKDLFSPGLPYFIAMTSSTSSNTPKYFAKYRHPSGDSMKEVDDGANPVSQTGGKNCIVFSLRYRDVIDVLDDAGSTVSKIPYTIMSSGSIRMQNGVDVEKDPWTIKMTAPRSTSPVAVGFIGNYRSFLLVHILFALADSQLETINTIFGTVFIDMIDYMQEEWDTLVDSIETGVLPDWPGTDEVRQYLEPKLTADPERAAYVRSIGKSPEQAGWLTKLWPMLKVVIGVASGIFAAIIPKARYWLGPDVHMRSLGFTASEAYIGTVYNSNDLNIFKVSHEDMIEYLDVTKPETPSSLAAGYEVEVGHRYEIVVTTRDGLWRYRLGDIIEIAGFDPTDGTPLMRYVERRNVAIFIGDTKISERQMIDSIYSTQDTLGKIAEFTVIVDVQKPDQLHFMVELLDDLSPSAEEAPARVEASLYKLNDKLRASGQTIKCTVQVVRQGTFRDYRRRKIEITGTGMVQIKVPVVMTDKGMQDWVLQHVEKVFGA